MFSEKTFRKDQAKGFSLVEVMVGMTVGLLSMLVIMQTLSVFETQKRSTTSGSDAQVNGLMALSSMEQSIRSAGAGSANSSSIVCTQIFAWTLAKGVIPNLSFLPVRITDGGATGSDSIAIQTAKDFLGNIPAKIRETMPATAATLKVSRTTGIVDNNLVLVADPATGNCTLLQATNVTASSGTLTFNRGSGSLNPPVGVLSGPPAWPAYTTGAPILNMGETVKEEFSLNANKLQVIATSLSAASGVNIAPALDLASDIVSLQAQYGIADTGTQNVIKWRSATLDAVSTINWAAPTAAQIKMIKAVRLVVVARSGKKELQDVTQDCTNTLGSGGINKGPCAWVDTAGDPAPKIDLSANADYKKYRYKVYTTIIPLRNVIWANI